MTLSIIASFLDGTKIEALVLLSILIYLLWPKEGYDEANTIGGRVALLLMHCGTVIFKLAGILIFSAIALAIIMVGLDLLILLMGALASGAERP